MHRWSFCEWIPRLPRPVWPLAGQYRLGQNRVVGSMVCLLLWRCWAACQEGVCQDPISIPTEPHHGLVESYPSKDPGGEATLLPPSHQRISQRQHCGLEPALDPQLREDVVNVVAYGGGAD